MQKLRLSIVLFLLLILASPANAWMRMVIPDDELVERSELVVVAGIKAGSLTYVPHEHKPQEGKSWEHHAVLLVREVLKGKCNEKEISVVIHYGLDPLVHGKMVRDAYPLPPGVAEGSIQIVDSGNSAISSEPTLKDAQQDNLWFLRRRSGIYGREPGAGKYGIVDPEDVKALTLKPYMLCYLEADPESAVRARIAVEPAIASRAMEYLGRREIARIKQIADPAHRVERIVPYLESPATRYLASEVIIGAGSVAGPYLLGLYERSWDPDLRIEVVRLWGKIRWWACADLLIDELKDCDRYWATQKLEQGWWNRDVGSAITETRRQNYSRVYYAVCTLRQLAEPKAREALQLTRQRWADPKIENKQIVEECDAALRDLQASSSTSPATAPGSKK